MSEPFWGPNAKPVALILVAGFITAQIAYQLLYWWLPQTILQLIK